MQLFEVMGDTIKHMLQAVDPIAFGCYATVFEFYNIALEYYYTVTSPRKLSYNVVHNLGRIYDDVTALVDIFRFGDYNQRIYW